jgi:pyrimidine-nucleoside phosphorylase
MNPEIRGWEDVGTISIGSCEEKIPLVLSRLMPLTGVVLSLSESFSFPKGHLEELTDRIESILQHKGIRSIVFDVRVREWPESKSLKTAQTLSQALQEICSRLQISSSVYLSNGCQPLGNLMGTQFEIIEAEDVLRGNGPPDVTKFALEIGADLLLMSKKVVQKRDGKKMLRDIIIQNKISLPGVNQFVQSITPFPSLKKMTILSEKKGYVHHLVIDEIHSLKSELDASHKESGFALLKKAGDLVEKEEGIVRLFLGEGEKNLQWESKFQKVFKILSDPPEFQPFILERSEIRISS